MWVLGLILLVDTMRFNQLDWVIEKHTENLIQKNVDKLPNYKMSPHIHLQGIHNSAFQNVCQRRYAHKLLVEMFA